MCFSNINAIKFARFFEKFRLMFWEITHCCHYCNHSSATILITYKFNIYFKWQYFFISQTQYNGENQCPPTSITNLRRHVHINHKGLVIVCSTLVLEYNLATHVTNIIYFIIILHLHTHPFLDSTNLSHSNHITYLIE
jgi:hypothetical protein